MTRTKWLTALSFIIYHLSFSPAGAQTRYIQAVDEYVPAPGQFVNTLPQADESDTPQTMAYKCTERLAGGAGQMITLGAFGGYVTFHFDHPVANVAGQMDIYIGGNANAGGSEPGIVMVSQDANGNHLPDDTWYELAGSADVDSVGMVVYGYEITYTKDGELHDIPWTDNRGQTGVVARNNFHKQEYFPVWMGGELTFTGTLLPSNGVQTSVKPEHWVLSSLRYGYADNVPNIDTLANSFNLDWAVDPISRQPVSLSHADFVRVYSAQNQTCGWLGETSTEVSGAEDLHLEASLQLAAGIHDVQRSTFNVQRIHDLQGRSVNRPSRGLYIIDGKKCIIHSY